MSNRPMGVREEAVQLVNDACGWNDLEPDSSERMETYDEATRHLTEYYEATELEAEAASRASAAAEELRSMGIEIEAR